MKFPQFITLILLGLTGFLSAQAPDGWTQIKKKTTVEIKGQKITQFGEWISEDETLTAIVANTGQVKTVKELGEKGAGMASGVIKSGIFPLAFESMRGPHPTIIVRGQAEYEGGEYFQDSYAILTKKGLIMVKVNGPMRKIPFDVKKWDFGEPIKDVKGEFANQMEQLSRDLTRGLAKLQGIVKKMRRAQKP